MGLEVPVGGLRALLERHQPPAGSETAFLGLGSNVGDRLYYLNRAVMLLHRAPRTEVADISSVYETEAVGSADRPYYNVAVRLLTTRSPARLLQLCQQVEDTLGRVRTTRWGPRTIDVDVLLYGERELDDPALTVPHPRLTERAFALVPLMEVAPGWRLPDGRSLARCVADLAPIEGVAGIGRQVSLTPHPTMGVGAWGNPDLPPDVTGTPPDVAGSS